MGGSEGDECGIKHQAAGVQVSPAHTPHTEYHSRHLCMANCHSSGDWQFKQPVAMALPTVILKAGWLRCWAARFLPGRVAG